MTPRLVSLAPSLRFATAWHVLWGALLIPYALVVVLVVGGLDPMQDLVDELAMSFLIVPLVLIVTLPVNAGLAVGVELLLRGVSWWVGALISAAFFGALWLLLATIFDLPARIRSVGRAGGLRPVGGRRRGGLRLRRRPRIRIERRAAQLPQLTSSPREAPGSGRVCASASTASRSDGDSLRQGSIVRRDSARRHVPTSSPSRSSAPGQTRGVHRADRCPASGTSSSRSAPWSRV